MNQLQSTSVYHIPINLPIQSITAYHSAFVSICVKYDSNTNFDLFVIGDFNMPDINLNTLSSPKSRDNEVVTHLAGLGLKQVINVATHKDGNILDLFFLNLKHLSFTLSQNFFFDHFPVVFRMFQCPKSLYHVKKIWSKSSFKPATFNETYLFCTICYQKFCRPMSTSVYGMINFSKLCLCLVCSHC